MSIVLLAIIVLTVASLVCWRNGRIRMARILGAFALVTLAWLAIGANIGSNANHGKTGETTQTSP